MTEFTTTALGDRVAYDRHATGLGDQTGPAVIFIVGGGPIWRAVDPQTTHTAQLAADAGLTAFVFDRLGRGESVADGPLTLERELAAVAAMIEVAGGRAALCGHSSGCSIALAAAHAGLPVSALVLWEIPVGEPSADVRAWIEEFERRLDAGDDVGAVEQFMKDMPPEWLEGMRQSPDFPAIARGVGSQRADGQSLVWATEALEDRRLATLTTPTLALYGTSTLPEMPPAAAWVASVVPTTTIAEAPGADHSWEPGPMAEALARFVLAHP